MKISVINGPNINMLGVREPEIYGNTDYQTLCKTIEEKCLGMGIEVSFFQSNHEGAIVDEIQNLLGKTDAVIINPAAYTHTSVAIADALKCVKIPYVEVHISDVSERERFRQVSFVRDGALKTVMGKGIAGYIDAVDILYEELNK